MTRLTRIIPPSSIVHVISRFINRQYLLVQDDQRLAYRERLGEAIKRSDWRLLSYAMMSTHIHLTLISGKTEFWSLIKGVHIGFATWLNRQQKRLGPVFAERPTTIVIDPVHWPRLIAYQHNNVVRAGLVDRAAESTWTSHRAYLGLDPRPSFLDASLGLKILGLSDNEIGRRKFDLFVNNQLAQPHDNNLSDLNLESDRRELRKKMKAAITCSYPMLEERGLFYRVNCQVKTWPGSIKQVLEKVSQRTGVSLYFLARKNRNVKIIAARRLTVLVARNLGFSLEKIGLALGISHVAAGNLVRARQLNEVENARQLTSELLNCVEEI